MWQSRFSWFLWYNNLFDPTGCTRWRNSLELTSTSEKRVKLWIFSLTVLYTSQWHSSHFLVNMVYPHDVKWLIVELCLLNCISSMGVPQRRLDCISSAAVCVQAAPVK